MQRRRFIHLVGGGTIAAAVLPMAGCSGAYPEEAVAGWTAAPPTGDARRWAVAHAILAPNPHNLQSWRVDLREPGAITLWVDAGRLLPETDPPGRQVLIGQGAFLELLVMALAERGLASDVTLFPEGKPGPRASDLPGKPVARVVLREGAGAARDPLFSRIRQRHTAKSDFDTTRAVEASAIAPLEAAARTSGVMFGSTLEGSRVAAMRELCWQSAQVEIGTPRTAMESLRLVRVGPQEIAQHRDGISVNTAMARFATAVGMFDRSAAPPPGSSGYEQMATRFEGHSRTAMGFVWLATPRGTRADAVNTGRAFVRMQLAAVPSGLAVHPMSQALQEFPEMAPHYERAHRLTLGRGSPASADEPVLQMFCRVGWPTVVAGATPRRALESVFAT
jgi:hypothetical protein